MFGESILLLFLIETFWLVAIITSASRTSAPNLVGPRKILALESRQIYNSRRNREIINTDPEVIALEEYYNRLYEDFNKDITNPYKN